MKAPKAKLEVPTPTAPFPKAADRPRHKPNVAGLKAKKRDNIFSKSRDTREDRGARQVKTASESHTFPHTR